MTIIPPALATYMPLNSNTAMNVGIGTTDPGGGLIVMAGGIGVGTWNTVNMLDVKGSVAIGQGYAGRIIAPTNGVIIEGNVGVGTTSPKGSFSVAGHFHTSGSPPTLSVCGTGPSVVGNDYAFTITGGTLANGCIATFASAYNKTPVCQVSQQTLSLLNVLSYTVTISSITISQVGLGTNKLDVVCIGRD